MLMHQLILDFTPVCILGEIQTGWYHYLLSLGGVLHSYQRRKNFLNYENYCKNCHAVVRLYYNNYTIYTKQIFCKQLLKNISQNRKVSPKICLKVGKRIYNSQLTYIMILYNKCNQMKEQWGWDLTTFFKF